MTVTNHSIVVMQPRTHRIVDTSHSGRTISTPVVTHSIQPS